MPAGGASPAASPGVPVFDCYTANSAWGLSYAGKVVDRDGRVWAYRQVGRALPAPGNDRTLDAAELRAKFVGANAGAQVEAGALAEKVALIDKAAAGNVTASDTGVRDAGTSTCHAYVADANGSRYRDVELGSDGGAGDRRITNDAPEAQLLLGWLRAIGVAKQESPQATRLPFAVASSPPAVPQQSASSMDEFSYLSVLMSIIIGLAITQILKGYRGIVLARARVELYWPVLLWSVSLLVMNIQSWWASFGLREVQHWTFAMFGIVLVQTIIQYMLAAIVLPDFFGERVNLREHYWGHARWLLGLTIAVLCASLAKDLVLTGQLTNPLNLGFHLIVIGLAAVSLLVRNETWHKAMAVGLALLFGAYIVVLFQRLPA